MKLVGIRELRDNLAEHITQAAQGEEVVIVQRSKPVARLVAYEEEEMSEDATQRAAERTANEDRLMALALSLAQGDRTEAARLAAKVAADLLTARAGRAPKDGDA